MPDAAEEATALAQTLKRKLPPHTYRAVFDRAERLPLAEDRRDLLRAILTERERSEAEG